MSNPNLSLRFTINYEGKSLAEAEGEIHSLKGLLESSVEAAKDFKKEFDYSQVAQAGYVLSSSLSSINEMLNDLSGAYAAQEVAEKKLAAVMRNTMGATDDDVEAIKKLTSAQQELGVIGDEVQLAGAQELSTYLGLRSSLETLIPVMNDMIAQQYGLGATQENAASIATMLGKVMEGQVSGLSRYGYYFDEAQEAVLKFGTEEEKAAVLAAVVEQAVGGMNKALAETASGAIQQTINRWGDIKESLGGIVSIIQPAASTVTAVAKSITDIFNAITAFGAIKEVLMDAVTKTLGWSKAAYAAAVSFSKLKIAALEAAASTAKANFVRVKTAALEAAASIDKATIATKAMTFAQKALDLVLSMNPMGIVVKALAGLVSLLTIAYFASDDFRKVCDSLWNAVKDLGTAVLNFLAPAFRKAGDAISFVWGYLKSLFGLSDTSTDVTKTYTHALDDNAAAALANADAYLALANAGNKVENTVKNVADTLTKDSLDYYQKQVSDLEKLINSSRPEDRPALLSRLEIAEDELKKAQDFLDLQKFSIRYTIKPEERVERDMLSPDTNFNLNPSEDLQSSPFKIATWTEVYKDALEDARKEQEDFITSTDLVAGAFSNIGKAVGGAAGAFLEWGANVAQSIATAIPQIMALTSVSEAEGQAAGKSAALKGASAVAGIPFVGPAMAIGAAASIVAALMAIPKFATGGIAYGPTLGLFGEYSGASRNPEVVAPLDRLRSLIEPAGGSGGQVEFVIDGRVLRGVLKKVDNISSRS